MHLFHPPLGYFLSFWKQFLSQSIFQFSMSYLILFPTDQLFLYLLETYFRTVRLPYPLYSILSATIRNTLVYLPSMASSIFVIHSSSLMPLLYISDNHLYHCMYLSLFLPSPFLSLSLNNPFPHPHSPNPQSSTYFPIYLVFGHTDVRSTFLYVPFAPVTSIFTIDHTSTLVP